MNPPSISSVCVRLMNLAGPPTDMCVSSQDVPAHAAGRPTSNDMSSLYTTRVTMIAQSTGATEREQMDSHAKII